VIKGLMVLVFVIMTGGCGKIEKTTVEEKTGVIVARISDEYILNSEKETVNVASRKINLEEYMNKKVRVKGMFSGTTLYVDEIEKED